MRRPLARVACAAVLALGTAGCGDTEPPGAAEPAIAEGLRAVDEAVSGGDPDDVRRALDALVRATTRARDADRIEEEQAEAVLDAAARLEAALPDDGSDPVTGEPSETATVPPEEDEEDEEDEDEAAEEAEKAREQAEKEAEKAREQAEKEAEKEEKEEKD